MRTVLIRQSPYLKQLKRPVLQFTNDWLICRFLKIIIYGMGNSKKLSIEKLPLNCISEGLVRYHPESILCTWMDVFLFEMTLLKFSGFFLHKRYRFCRFFQNHHVSNMVSMQRHIEKFVKYL